jgi:predicted DNA-binding transcriptional regulator AlpA
MSINDSASKPMHFQPILIDVKAVANLLGRSVASVQRDDNAGRIPRPIMIGRSKRWRCKELRAWVRLGCPIREVWEARWRTGKR